MSPSSAMLLIRQSLSLSLVAMVLLAPVAWPCATVDPNGLQTKVSAERAIIVFDAATQTEHFIREADFASHGEPFGFIVPTPTLPTFAEADTALFSQLDAAWEALRRTERHLELGAFLSRRSPLRAPLDQVHVLSQTRVAGMEVVVVKADEGAALSAWFEQHGFDLRPALKAWVDAYVARGFVFSAFRYPGGPTVGSKAVRISFSTPVPVYPYLEPDDAAREGGLLVWVVAPEARSWTESGADQTPPAVLLRSSALAVPPALEALFAGKKTVTLFHDTRLVRPKTDVQFVAATQSAEVLPPPRPVPVYVPLDLLCPLLLVVLVLVLMVRRSRRAA